MSALLRYAALALLLPAPALAQEDGGTFLEGLLERSLAGEGRDVRVTGFRGALSSSATIERLTFADPQGVWLTIEDIVLDWNRAALLRGRLSVEELRAGAIVLARLPQEGGGAGVPSPEASGFRLPDLPVAVEIGSIATPAITFGEPVFGIESVFSLAGRLNLEDGEGAGALEVARIDGPEGRFDVEAAFSNATGVLALALDLQEAPGGIVATLAGIPGEPSVDLSVEGEGPLTDFEATLALATGGEDRLSGRLAIGGEGVGPGDPRPFRAEIAGDIAPLFAPAYGAFFGDRITLLAAGVRGADGALDLDTFALEARTVALEGTLALGADGRPRRFDLDGRIAGADGAPVLLPIPGEPTRVDAVTLSAAFDAASGDAWTGRFLIDGLDRPGFSAAEILLDGGGTFLGLRDDAPDGVTAGFDFAAEALDLGDPAAGAALGERVTGRIDLTRRADAPLEIARFDIAGESYALNASGTLDIDDRDLAVAGRAEVAVEDLSAFSGIAGRPLSGAARLALSGEGAILGGTFDAEIEGRTVDLAVGEPRIDGLVRGATELAVDAARDEAGITLRTFRLASPQARVTAEGAIRSAATRLVLSATLEDAGVVLPGLEGRHTLALETAAEGEVWTIDAALSGGTLSGAVDGRLDLSGPAPAFDGTAALDAARLAPLSDLAGRPDLAGAVSLRFEGAAAADLSRFDARLVAEEDGLRVGDARIDGVLARGLSLRLDAARQDGGPVTLRALSAASGDATVSAEGTLSGLPGRLAEVGAGVLDTAAFDGRLAVEAGDLAPFGPLAGLPGLAGAMTAEASGALAFDLSRFDLDLDLAAEGLATGRAELDPLLAGEATVALTAAREAGGPVALDRLAVALPAASLAVEGAVTGLPGALVPPPPDLDGAAFEGTVALSARDLGAVGPLAGLPNLAGALDARLEGRVAADLDSFDVRVTAEGRRFRTGIAEADAYLAGTSDLRLDAAREDGTIDIRSARFAAPGVTATAEGAVTDAGGDLSATVRLDDLGRVVPDFSGPATVQVRARTETGGPWRVDGTIDGPGGTTFRTEGTVARSFDRVDLGIRGTVPLGLANPFLAPRSVSGTAAIDLRVAGPPALNSVSGQVMTSDARLVAPTLGIVLERVAATVSLSGGRAQIDTQAAVQGGGRVAVAGPVTLSAPFPADLRITLSDARLRDPALYETTVSGDLTLRGPLAGGAGIAGAIALGPTELRIPSGVSGGAVPIPTIAHRAEPRPVRITRRRAGLIDETGSGNGTGGGGAAYGLDIRIDAANRIFVRGRGLDAELGGAFRIGGTTADVVPSGALELVRGRLDILGRRLVLDQGSITVVGDFDPFIRLVATTQAEDFVVSVVLEGRLSDPEVRFESTPELPQDEVVARLLFGRGIDTISPFQAAQLAASVATLTGGGNGLLGNLRQGLGIDDLDIATNAAGQTQLTLGTYISDNLYTDVEISDGRTEIEINLELTPTVTLQGSTADDGTSSIGIRYERDY